MANTRHTNYSRPRRGRTAEVATKDETSTEEGIGAPPKMHVFTKSASAPIRIRKGPGLQYEHTGEYLGTGPQKVRVCEIVDGWGLLKKYEETRDGWVCLEFLDKPEE